VAASADDCADVLLGHQHVSCFGKLDFIRTCVSKQRWASHRQAWHMLVCFGASKKFKGLLCT